MPGDAAGFALLGAMKEEVDGPRKLMQVERADALGGGLLWEGRWAGRAALLLQTGPGRRSVERVLDALLSRYSVSGLISFGFAGALDPSLKVGDLLLCDRLWSGEGPPGAEGCDSDPRLLTLAGRQAELYGGRARVGAGVTVGRLVRTRGERETLWKSRGAGVVDMESYWVGMRARAQGIPFLAVRAVSDTAEHLLPPLDRCFGPDGRWRWSLASAHFAAHPADLLGIPRIYRDTRRAAAKLTTLLDALVPVLP